MRALALATLLSSATLFACSSSSSGGGSSTEVDAGHDIGLGSGDTRTDGAAGDPDVGDAGGGADGKDTGPAVDAGPCTIESDPCYKEATAAYAASLACFDHANTCEGGDPSGCGASTDKGATCKWPDGSEEDTTTDATSGDTTIVDKGVGGKECARYVISGTSTAFTQKLTIDSKTYTLSGKTVGGGTVYTLTCPSGTSVTFKDVDVTGCTGALSGNTCCTTTTPPTCPTGV